MAFCTPPIDLPSLVVRPATDGSSRADLIRGDRPMADRPIDPVAGNVHPDYAPILAAAPAMARLLRTIRLDLADGAVSAETAREIHAEITALLLPLLQPADGGGR
jgi:hypothetical protein